MTSREFGGRWFAASGPYQRGNLRPIAKEAIMAIYITESMQSNPIPNLVKRLLAERDSSKAVELASEAAGVLTNHLSRMGRMERAQWAVWFGWLIRGLKGHIDGWAHRILEQGLLQGTSRPRI